MDAAPPRAAGRVWAAFIGIDPDELTGKTSALARDHDALVHLVRVVEDQRSRLRALGAPTADADALLVKLQWELAATRGGAAVPQSGR